MLIQLRRVGAIASAALLTLAATLTPICADTILDTDTFSFSQPDPDPELGPGNQFAPGGTAASTETFSLTSADISNIMFEANFDFIDAGIEILVNGESLFNTGPDVSQFNGASSTVFTQTGATNLGVPFEERSDLQPRLTVSSDSTGTIFSGPDLSLPDNNPAPIINFTPGFTINDFTSLLQVGENQIQIVNLNAFDGASLGGDFTLTLVAPAASVPEPTALSLCLIGATCCMLRRRRR